MLKVSSSKRSFDAMSLETPVNEARGASLIANPSWMSPPSPKRLRIDSWTPRAPTPTNTLNSSLENDGNTFVLPSEADLAALSADDRKLLEWMPKNKRLKFLANGPQAKLFTALDVKQTVQNAISETQRMLSIEYEKVLQLRLQEQYQNFSRYSQDSIHQYLKESKHNDYIS